MKIRLLTVALLTITLSLAGWACGDGDGSSSTSTSTSTSTGGSVQAYLQISWLNAGTWDNLIIKDYSGTVMVEAGMGTGGLTNTAITPSEESALVSALDACSFSWSASSNPMVFGSSGDPTYISEIKLGQPSADLRQWTVIGSPTTGSEYKSAADAIYDVWNAHK